MYQNVYYDRDTRTIHLWDSTTGYRAFPFKRYAYYKDPDGTYQSMFGEPLKKIHRWNEDTDLELFEADVSPTTRVLVDLYTDDDLPSDGHTVLTFDIEVDISIGLPDWRNPINKVTSVAMHDSISKEYIVFVLDEDDRIQDVSHSQATVIPCHDEDELLSRVLDEWEKINPTIITGWNILGFDVPYLYSRLQYVKGDHEAGRLSPIGIVSYNERRNRFFIAGVSSLDYLPIYKKFSYTQKPSYALDNIGRDELDLGKVEYDGSLQDLFESDLNKFIDYNIRDVEIVVKLDEKFQYIELVRGICHAGHVPYEDIEYSSRYLDGAVLTFLKRRGVVAPNRPRRTKEMMKQMGDDRDKFEGAYVKAPNPGRYEWVYDLDLTSLYPSIIMSLNISPETKVGKVVDWNVNDYLRGKDRTYTVKNTKFTYDELKSFIDEHDMSISSNGVLYDTSSPGVLPAILNEWFEQRVKYKNLMKQYGNSGDQAAYEFYDKRQLVQKILLNCFTPDHDVMTVDGARNITELEIGDLVYSINPSTMEVEIKPVTKVYHYDYEGDIVSINTTHIDFKVTPNHRLLTSKERHPRIGGFSDYDWEYAGQITTRNMRRLPPKVSEFPGTDKLMFDLSEHYDGPHIIKEGRIRYDTELSDVGRNSTKYQPCVYDMELWLSFLGWYISEGSLHSTTPKSFPSGNARGPSHVIQISQKSARGRTAIRNALTQMGIEFGETDQAFTFSSQVIYEVLEEQCGRGSSNKKIPEWVFSLPGSKLSPLYESLMMGGGDVRGTRYTTISKRLADDFVRLVHHIGNRNAFVCDYGEGYYRVQIGHTRGITPTFKPRKHVHVHSYSGTVHCVEVQDNHTLLAGRNGKFNWIGQSLYGVLGLPVFRFYDVDNAEAVTTTGKKVIKFTEKCGNTYYNNMLCPHEVYVDLDNGKTLTLRSIDTVRVIRDGVERTILAGALTGDDKLLLGEQQ